MAKREDEDQLERNRDYAKDYYQRNKEEIARKKKLRYQNDPEYRQNIRDAEARRKERLKEERKIFGFHRKSSLKIKKVMIEAGGRSFLVEVVTLGFLARTLGKTSEAVRVWENKGILPEAPYRTENGTRLYPLFQVKEVSKIWKEFKEENQRYKKFPIVASDLKDRLRELWTEYPLGFDPDKEEEIGEEDEE